MTEPQPSPSEIAGLLEVAQRELVDAGVAGLSSDGRFGHAYNAALALATVAVRSAGLRVHGQDHHRLTFQTLGDIANQRWRDLAQYLQHCRARRNRAVYEFAGATSEAEADELRQQVEGFRSDLEHWLRDAHPGLLRGP